MIRATIQFDNGKRGSWGHSNNRSWHRGGRRGWGVTREFKDQQHLDNFIAYMEREKGFTAEEVYILNEKS